MDTAQEIRRANLRLLLQEVERELKSARGAQAELSRRTGVPGPFISQFLRRQLHQGGGERSMGDETARKLERGMQKIKGWMDVAHATADGDSSEVLAQLQALTPEQRAIVEAHIAEFARLNRQAEPQPPDRPAAARPH